MFHIVLTFKNCWKFCLQKNELYANIRYTSYKPSVIVRLDITFFFCKNKMLNDFSTNEEEGNELVIYFFFFFFPVNPQGKRSSIVWSFHITLYHHDLPAEELCVDVAFYQSIRCCYYVSFYGIVLQGEFQG